MRVVRIVRILFAHVVVRQSFQRIDELEFAVETLLIKDGNSRLYSRRGWGARRRSGACAAPHFRRVVAPRKLVQALLRKTLYRIDSRKTQAWGMKANEVVRI